jgi:hypothetical protein
VWPQQVRTTLPYCTILRTDYSHTESRWSFVFWRAQIFIPVINQKGVFSIFPRRSPAIMMILGVLVSTYRPKVSNCVSLEYALYSNDALAVWVLYQRYLRMVIASKPIPVMGLVHLLHDSTIRFVVSPSHNTRHSFVSNPCLLVLLRTILVDCTLRVVSCYGPWRWNIT